MTKVLVTGGRFYINEACANLALDELHADRGITALAHGGASGADTLGGLWAIRNGIPVQTFHAEWDKYHGVGRNPAGFIRNKKMLDEFQPDVVVAFPGGAGTKHMVQIARKAAVEVIPVDWGVNHNLRF